MSCCSSNTPKSVRPRCPECGESCLSLTMQTLIHQVQFPDNQNLIEAAYSFCSNRQCHVGYFAASIIIPKQQLRAFKTDQQDMLCYCFDISESLYQSALESGTAGSVKSFVIEQTTSGDCACESRNPSGCCCLANFKRLEKNYEFA